jgi:hypothetical protein
MGANQQGRGKAADALTTSNWKNQRADPVQRFASVDASLYRAI